MNEATKYNRAKTWQIALFALNMMSTNMYLFLMMYVSYYANGILGMSVVFVSTLATSMRIFDGFTDPIIPMDVLENSAHSLLSAMRFLH